MEIVNFFNSGRGEYERGGKAPLMDAHFDYFIFWQLERARLIALLLGGGGE